MCGVNRHVRQRDVGLRAVLGQAVRNQQLVFNLFRATWRVSRSTPAAATVSICGELLRQRQRRL